MRSFGLVIVFFMLGKYFFGVFEFFFVLGIVIILIVYILFECGFGFRIKEENF